MIFERIKSAGIAHNSYLVGSDSEAAVIDPCRDCQIYVDSAQQMCLKIKHIFFETHRNEDYVIGSIELANITGTEIYHGPGLDWKYGSTLRDRQQFHKRQTGCSNLQRGTPCWTWCQHPAQGWVSEGV